MHDHKRAFRPSLADFLYTAEGWGIVSFDSPTVYEFVWDEKLVDLYKTEIGLSKKNENFSVSNFSFYTNEFLFYESSGDLNRWAWKVKSFFSFRCLISNEKSPRNLHAHHLFGKKAYPKLKFYYLNGLPIQASFHSLFHTMYGSSNTRDDFLSFVDFLELSNDSRIKKENLLFLKNWLQTIKPILFQLLT